MDVAMWERDLLPHLNDNVKPWEPRAWRNRASMEWIAYELCELKIENINFRIFPRPTSPDFGACGCRVDVTEADAACTRRACTCERCWRDAEERGCRRFEVALILSRQGGDCSLVVSSFASTVWYAWSSRRGTLVSRDVPFSTRWSLHREEQASLSGPLSGEIKRWSALNGIKIVII